MSGLSSRGCDGVGVEWRRQGVLCAGEERGPRVLPYIAGEGSSRQATPSRALSCERTDGTRALRGGTSTRPGGGGWGSAAQQLLGV